MIPEDKIIDLINEYLSVSETLLTQNERYVDRKYEHGMGIAYANCANDLEKLLKSNKEGGKTDGLPGISDNKG